MKKILRFRWAILFIWLFVAAGLFFLAPNLQELVREKGQITAPADSPSVQAKELLNQMDDIQDRHTSNAVLVFHHEKSLTKKQMNDITKGIDLLKEQQDTLGISNILDFREEKAIESQTISEDNTTVLLPFQISFQEQEINESKEAIYQALDSISVEHYLTGEDYINQDIITNSEEGLKKTEIITIGFILVILFFVFKSLIAPLIPLLTVGISYLAAQGIVAILAETTNFPLSTYTQIFMVAVMFGIGTDYCILMISRFKEELEVHESTEKAVIATYKGAGKTIFFAAIAVLIGFSTIGLSSFSLYKSAVAVAIGVFVVCIALFTLVPILLVLLGKNLFWPFNQQVRHKESKIWSKLGHFSWSRPILSLLIVFILIIPAILSYEGVKSYNNLDEIGEGYKTVKGFHLIANHFGPGEAMPVTVVMKTNHPIESRSDFQTVETISNDLERLPGVETVRSATRPSGKILEDFLVDEQTQFATSGLEEATKGLTEIQEALSEASGQLEKSKPSLIEATDGVKSLMEGINHARNGVNDLRKGFSTIEDAIQSSRNGTAEVKEKLKVMADELKKIISHHKTLQNGYEKIASGLQDATALNIKVDQIGDLSDLDRMTTALQQAIEQVQYLFDTSVQENPALQKNKSYVEAYQTAIGTIEQTIEGIAQIKNQLKSIQKNANQLNQLDEKIQQEVILPLEKLNASYDDLMIGEEKLLDGLYQLLDGMNELESGLKETKSGQKQLVNEMVTVQDGLSEIYGGQRELENVFKSMHDELDSYASGLTEGANGLEEIHDGLVEMKHFLNKIERDTSNPLVYIPEEALVDENFIEASQAYIGDDSTIVKWDVILDVNPYSTDAMELITKIKEKATTTINDTVFQESTPKLAGVTSTNYDLQKISDEDYAKTATFMIVGIFGILVVLLRSLVMPLYLIGSLVLTYITSMAFAEFIFVRLAGFDGLTWAVPFFSFVMLIALGIDYSIFLMDRFHEYEEMSIKEGLLKAMKNMGTVIISAAIILGGTFSAMLPSGVLSILQIATVVLTGLFLYAFVMLPLFIPVMVRLFGEANWWPFKK